MLNHLSYKSNLKNLSSDAFGFFMKILDWKVIKKKTHVKGKLVDILSLN